MTFIKRCFLFSVYTSMGRNQGSLTGRKAKFPVQFSFTIPTLFWRKIMFPEKGQGIFYCTLSGTFQDRCRGNCTLNCFEGNSLYTYVDNERLHYLVSYQWSTCMMCSIGANLRAGGYSTDGETDAGAPGDISHPVAVTLQLLLHHPLPVLLPTQHIIEKTLH